MEWCYLCDVRVSGNREIFRRDIFLYTSRAKEPSVSIIITKRFDSDKTFFFIISQFAPRSRLYKARGSYFYLCRLMRFRLFILRFIFLLERKTESSRRDKRGRRRVLRYNVCIYQYAACAT